jgi:hypothetical protein
MYLMGVYHGMQPVLLSRTYVFAAFDGRWPGVSFLILALSGNFGGFSLGPPHPPYFGDANLGCPNNPTPERSRVPATLVLKQSRFQIQFFGMV